MHPRTAPHMGKPHHTQQSLGIVPAEETHETNELTNRRRAAQQSAPAGLSVRLPLARTVAVSLLHLGSFVPLEKLKKRAGGFGIAAVLEQHGILPDRGVVLFGNDPA